MRDLRVHALYKATGTRWIRIPTGILSSANGFRLVRNYFNDGPMRTEVYKVANEGKVLKFREWLLKNVAPLLNTRPLDERHYAEEAEYMLELYGQSDCSPESCLLLIPLATVFEDFTKEDFFAMMRAFGADKGDEAR